MIWVMPYYSGLGCYPEKAKGLRQPSSPYLRTISRISSASQISLLRDNFLNTKLRISSTIFSGSSEEADSLDFLNLFLRANLLAVIEFTFTTWIQMEIRSHNDDFLRKYVQIFTLKVVHPRKLVINKLITFN